MPLKFLEVHLHSSTHSLLHSLSHPLTRSLSHSLTLSPSRPLTLLLSHSLSLSLSHSLTLSLSHSLSLTQLSVAATPPDLTHTVCVFARLYTCTYHIDLYVWLKKRALYMLVLVGCWPVNSGYQPYRQRAVRAILAVSPTHPRSAHT